MLRKILVVEDSPTQAARLCLLLEDAGYVVEQARHGQEGWQRVQAEIPDLIISDIVMPTMDGYAFCQVVKSHEATRRVPFVFLTDRNTPADILLGLEHGADNFITKPFEDAYLLERVQRILVHLERRQQGHVEAVTPVRVGGHELAISADKQQIIELLLATFAELHTARDELVKTNRELVQLTHTLEDRVVQRTAELRQANAQLQHELAERQRAEDTLRARDEEIRATSQQLWQAAKLATMGELAASIAHELNNPLATVSLRIDFLIAQVPTDDPKQRFLAVIKQETERMATLVANLLQFSRRSQPQVSSLYVCEEIDNTLGLVQYHLRNRRITVVREFAPAVPMMRADRQQLRQVFLNLITNASDAMLQGGTLTIQVTTGVLATAVPAVVIEFVDTGVGIPLEHLPKVMEPFYTTKPEGQGTGLGLAICRRIVQECRGTFDLASVVDQGTTVRLTLPIQGS